MTTNKNLEVQKTLVVSTAHVNKNDFRVMKNLRLYESNYYHRFELPYFDLYEEGVTVLIQGIVNPNDLGLMGFSHGFVAVLTLAHILGCEELKIDRDGPTISFLRAYEWE